MTPYGRPMTQRFQFLMEFLCWRHSYLVSCILTLQPHNEIGTVFKVGVNEPHTVCKKLHKECKPSWWNFWKKIGSTGKNFQEKLIVCPLGNILKLPLDYPLIHVTGTPLPPCHWILPTWERGSMAPIYIFFWNGSFFLQTQFFGFLINTRRFYGKCWVSYTRMRFFLYPFSIRFLSVCYMLGTG